MSRKSGNNKSLLKIAIAILAILVLCFVGIIFRFDFKETIDTNYVKIDSTDEQLIETNYFKIRTPKGWIHIFSGYGDEGDPNGYFITGFGRMFYEYGMFGPGYDENDDIEGYTVEKRTIGRFQVNIATNNKNETGVAIKPQHEMNRTLSFYMDKSVTKNLEQVLNGIRAIEFKQNDY